MDETELPESPSSTDGFNGLVDEAVEAIGAAWGLGELGFVHCTHSCVWDLH